MNWADDMAERYVFARFLRFTRSECRGRGGAAGPRRAACARLPLLVERIVYVDSRTVQCAIDDWTMIPVLLSPVQCMQHSAQGQRGV